MHIEYYSILPPISPVQTQTFTQITTHKHLLPPEFSSNPGLSPPLSSFRHSSCYSFCLLPFTMTSSALLFCSKRTFSLLRAHPGTKQRLTHCYFLLLTVPSSFSHLICSLLCPCYSHTHNNKIPSTAISHQLHAWGVASQGWPRNKDTQSVVVGTAVCQSHLHDSIFSQLAR